MRILNLYAGIGGNRKYWNSHSITAVEKDSTIASCYSSNFPRDNLLVGDCIQIVQNLNLDHYDFIWASPPCTSHSQLNMSNIKKRKLIPDLTQLYGLILFLRYFTKNSLWAVENVEPYYAKLMPPTIKLGKHLIWSNFPIKNLYFETVYHEKRTTGAIIQDYQIDISLIMDLPSKKIQQILRNCVDPQIGLYVLKQTKAKGLEDYIVAKG